MWRRPSCKNFLSPVSQPALVVAQAYVNYDLFRQGEVVKKGKIFVISAASGSGKTTLVRGLLKECKNLVVSKSYTTRALRANEKNRRDYIFVSGKVFAAARKKKAFLEWAKVFGNYYGTPADFVEKKLKTGKSVVLVIDVQGAFKVKKAMPGAVLVFIMPPSLRELENRLRKRKSDRSAQIKLRLKTARAEIAQAKRYDYIVINDNLSRAQRQLKEIVDSECGTEG
ncbi:MAG: guanylate kinase [Candidatus Omnitrophica bacterium CG12_big_fil_rev_8_21_14_0_65_43_15]|uniref:Guanylate kinase n=1 Tax=Candidatus Taenaricola geysiri TaxID=1974752 RepID=A0A2J0LPI3_9BACT|nr:MAG: guanylate kinase [Candidatus Omnitrophica bacterium CG12_big_fil_rev_8_21_14_0_65_43_15]PIY83889.1 MAG: guanylate kinase [Candidatus Omnitrophica bacterium CG_4_10_14_0_8_um_filter_43_18]PJC46448.1 MAG: guanylate kinase [Candidatus Omnitrophica bacterium CG_4_9_14_0_2_um_filter_43_12]